MEFVSWGDEIPNIWKVIKNLKNVPNHHSDKNGLKLWLKVVIIKNNQEQ